MLNRIAILLTTMTALLPSAPMLFFGFDPEGSGFANAINAREQFMAHIRGGGTESFGSDCGAVCEPYPLFFSPNLTGQMTAFPGGIFPVANGPDGDFRAIYEENGWRIGFSTGVSALGFYVTNLLYVVSDDGQGSLLQLTTGNGPPIFIDPGVFGFDRFSRFTGFVGFIDYDASYNSVDFGAVQLDTFTNRFYTGFITAAEPGEVIPEPSPWLSLAIGIALASFLRRAPVS